jgi:hypothetical protein
MIGEEPLAAEWPLPSSGVAVKLQPAFFDRMPRGTGQTIGASMVARTAAER